MPFPNCHKTQKTGRNSLIPGQHWHFQRRGQILPSWLPSAANFEAMRAISGGITFCFRRCFGLRCSAIYGDAQRLSWRSVKTQPGTRSLWAENYATSRNRALLAWSSRSVRLIASALSALRGRAAMAVNQGNWPRTRPRNNRSSASATGPRAPQQAQAGAWAPSRVKTAIAGAETSAGASASKAIPSARVPPGARM